MNIQLSGPPQCPLPASLAVHQKHCTWIKKFEADLADNGAAADQAQRIKQLERDNKELQRANEILRKAAAFFAQAELDRK